MCFDEIGQRHEYTYLCASQSCDIDAEINECFFNSAHFYCPKGWFLLKLTDFMFILFFCYLYFFITVVASIFTQKNSQ